MATGNNSVEYRAILDSSGVKAGAAESRQAIESIGSGSASALASVTTGLNASSAAAQSLAAAGAQGAQGLHKVSEAAKEAESSQRQARTAGEQYINMLREQVAVQGMSSAELMRYRAQELGVANAAAPYISALEEASRTNKKGALSAKEHANAMRMLPMQMTDVVTSLASGMPVWMVAIQQGGQIKDSFHGVGNAVKAMVGAISPSIAVVGGLAAVGASVGLAYYQGSQEVDKFRLSLVVSGNQAGTSVDQLDSMARSMKGVIGTQYAGAAALAEMAKSSQVGAKNLQEYTTSAVLWEKATGQAVAETAKQFAALAKDPLKASLALNDQMNHLTVSVYNQIRALDEQGKKEEAVEVAQRAYSAAMNSRQAEIKAHLGTLERAWNSVGETAKKAWDKILDVGRPTTPLSAQEKAVAELEAQIADRNRRAQEDGDKDGNWAKGTEKLQARLKVMKDLQGQMSSVDTYIANMAANQKNYVDAAESLAQAAHQGQSAEEKRVEAVGKLRAEYEKAVKAAQGLNDVDLDKLNRDYEKAVRVANAANQPSIDRNSMLDAVAHVESGGRQTDKNGNVITSSVGALGMYQIMPSSGPHMAQLAGVEWSQARLQQDADYGRTLASAYIDYLMRSFDGDAVKALTAYHSGQGNVNKAITKAGPGGDWLQNMGPEGQKYAAKVLGQFTTDAQGNYNGLREGVAPNKEAIAEQQKLREMQDATAAATASMKAQQDGYNQSMAEFIGMQATKAWETLTPEMQAAQEQQAIAKSNTDALAQSHSVLDSALKGARSGWEDYAAATAGASNYTREMASEQARYDEVLRESVKNGLTEATLLKAKEEHLRAMSALQEKEAITSAASLARQAEQLEETNKHYGKSAVVIGEMTAQRLKDALATELQTNGNTELAKALQAQVTQQERANAAMSKAELNKVMDSFKERTRSARETMAVSEQELQLMGLSGIERVKAVAQLEAQLRIKKDIAELERKGLKGAELETASEAAKTAALEEAQAKVQQSMVDEWKKTVDQYDQIFSQGFADMLNNGKDGWKSFTKSLTTTFKTTVADQIYKMFIKPIVVNIVGSFLGVSGMGSLGGIFGGGDDSGGSNIFGMASNANTAYGVGSALYGGYAGNYFLQGMGANIANGLGMGSWATSAGNWLNWGTTQPTLDMILGTGTSTTAGGTAGASASGMTGAGLAIAIPLIAAYLGGMFKDEKMVGQGLTGDLGGDMYGYQLMRESGGLFDGPDYRYVIAEKEIKETKAKIESLKKDNPYAEYGERGEARRDLELQELYNKLDVLERNYGAAIEGSKQPISILQEAYGKIREDVATKGETLGLDGDAVRKMKVSLGLDEIHPDTGGKGLDLTGLSEQEASAKIQKALQDANEELARSLLGSYQQVTREITTTVWEQVQVDNGGDTEQFQRVGHEVTETVTEMQWVMNEYVREGETAVQALDRMATGLSVVNQAFDLLGASALDASLASGDWASKLVEAIGGIDKFGQAVNTYYDLYYSPDEKQAHTVSTVNKAMEDKGLDLRAGDADAKKKYRALVEKAIADKDEELLAWLLQFADDFAAGADAASAALEDGTKALQAKLDEITKIRNETLNTLGLSTDGLVNGFITEINEGRGAQAGAWLADTIASGFEQAIYGQALTIVMNSIIDGVITPVVTAAMTGSSVSAAVSGAAIDTMVANATAAADALTALLTDPAFKQAMEKIFGVVRDLGNTIGASIPKMQSYKPAVTNLGSAYDYTGKAAETAAAAAKKLADEWQKTIEQMVNTVRKVRGDASGDGQDGLSYWRAQLAIDTAAAKAGDKDAADRLSGIVQKLSEMESSNAATWLENQRAQAQLAMGLEETARYLAKQYGITIPGFASGGVHAGGLRIVGENGPELEMTGPSRILNNQQLGELFMGSGGDDNHGLIDAVSRMHMDMIGSQRATNKLLIEMLRLFESWDRRGMPPVRAQMVAA